MSRKRNELNSPSLQGLVDDWLRRLTAERPGGQPTEQFAELSPLKKSKHAPFSNFSNRDGGVPARLVRLLTARVVECSLNRAEAGPDILDLLLEPLQFQGMLDGGSSEVAAEIAALDPDLLSGLALAGLNLWQADAAGQKRSGAFYTAPDLARYITARTLEGLPPDLPVLDPACGGGVFLLTALELERGDESNPVADLVLKRLYGLDLNPVAVVLARLALLRQLASRRGPLPPTLALAIAAQVRLGNALVGAVRVTEGPLPAQVEARNGLFEAIRSGQTEPALRLYRQWEKSLSAGRLALADQIARLPIFDRPDDGPRLAGRHPFGWELEFPEVMTEDGFGAVVGNPPYVGFNDYSGLEKAYFAHAFAPVYGLKSDLLYYFIARSVELLRPGGRVGLVTSRFWKEATFAAPLRRWLTSQTTLLAVEDRGGEQLFAGANVDVCLLFASRARPAPAHTLLFRHAGRVEEVAQARLDSAPWAWLRRLPAERLLLAQIEETSRPLGELAQCRTGVQTGLDRVFLVEEAVARQLEAAVLRRAIKNGDISAGRIRWAGLWLIYGGAGFEIERYPALRAYLTAHRADLERRRRYSTPFPFYELQWPRDPAVFEAPAKLVTPYKAPRNTFAVDRDRLYFSTDVVSVVFPPAWGQEDLAANFLNSCLSTFQFRSVGKPVGGGQWDYYANPVKRLAFPRAAWPNPAAPDPNPWLQRLSKPGLAAAEIDWLVAQLYGLTTAQADLIART